MNYHTKALSDLICQILSDCYVENNRDLVLMLNELSGRKLTLEQVVAIAITKIIQEHYVITPKVLLQS